MEGLGAPEAGSRCPKPSVGLFVPKSLLPGRVSTIDRNHRAGDVAGSGRGEKQTGRLQFAGTPYSTHGISRGHAFFNALALQTSLGHLRWEPSRRDRVYRDAVASPFDGELPGYRFSTPPLDAA